MVDQMRFEFVEACGIGFARNDVLVHFVDDVAGTTCQANPVAGNMFPVLSVAPIRILTRPTRIGDERRAELSTR